MKKAIFICTQCNNPVKQPCCELATPSFNKVIKPLKCPFGFENVNFVKQTYERDMNTDIKACIYWNGDPEAGINGGMCEAEIPVAIDDEIDKEQIRKIIKDTYEYILCESVTVYFSDEPICGTFS